MGHRYMFTPLIVETDNDQGWNDSEQPHLPTATDGASNNSSLVNPVDNIAVEGVRNTSHWAHAPWSRSYSQSMLNGELLHYQPQASGFSHDPFLCQFAAGNYPLLQDNYSHQSSSVHLSGHMIPVADGGFPYQAIGNSGGPMKRKYPGDPPLNDRGSTIRFYDVGSSSNIHLPADPWEVEQNAESYNTSWEYHPSAYMVNNPSIGSNGTLRNVRSRAEEDLEITLSRTHLPSNSMHSCLFNRSSDQSNHMGAWGQSSNGSTRERNQNFMFPPGHEVTYVSASGSFTYDPNTMNALTIQPNVSAETGDHHNDVNSNMNLFPQKVNSNLNQCSRGLISGYGSKLIPFFGASSNNFQPGHLTASHEGLQIAAENYNPINHRALPSVRIRNIDKNERALISSEMHKPFDEEASVNNRLEGLVILENHPTFFGSRLQIDQHRDLRLDTEDMSYEELLDLGERIGSVSTGLSDELIAKCLMESIYCSSDLFQDDETCVICLEEYKHMDDVGMIKACGHDFHVSCIRKWLYMKNLCPICKVTAMDG